MAAPGGEKGSDSGLFDDDLDVECERKKGVEDDGSIPLAQPVEEWWGPGLGLGS